MINSINIQNTQKRDVFGNVTNRTSNADYWLAEKSQQVNISNTLGSILPDPIILNPEEARKTNNLKIIGLSIASVTILAAAGIMFVLRGGPKGLAKGFQFLRNFLERKVQKSKLMGLSASKYEYMLSTIDYWLGKAQSINNFTTIKDFTFKKIMIGGNNNRKITSRIHSGITNMFEKLGLTTVSKSYKNTISKFGKLSDMNDAIISKLEKEGDLSSPVTVNGITLTKGEFIEFLKQRSKETQKLIKDNFSESVRQSRYSEIKKFTKELEQTFEEKGPLWFLSKDTLNMFVAEAKMLPKKLQIQNRIKSVKQNITYTKRDLYKDADEIIMNISSNLGVADNEALEALNIVRENFKTLSKTGNISMDKMSKDLAYMKSQLLNKSSAKLNPDINLGGMADDLTSLYFNYKPGNVQDILATYKVLLPKEQYNTIEKLYNQAVKSLNKSVKLETEDFINKSRDLTMGSAPTDVLAVLGGLGTLAYYLGKSDNAQERTAITLKYGIPALVGIGVSLYGNARLFAGSKSLLFASLSSFVANRIGTIANNLYENYLKRNGKYIETNKKES